MMSLSPNDNFLKSLNRVLILCAHTDDEAGCAGAIIRLVNAGVEVRYVALSRCEESVPKHYPEDVLEKECRECTKLLGIKQNMVEVWNYPVRNFPDHRQDILERFISLNREYEPDMVLLPSSFDMHQDHSVVFKEGFRAFKYSSTLGFEQPQNLVSFSNNAFITLTEEQVNQKIHALSSYESQAFRVYSSPDFVRGLAKVRGVQCNAVYAEAFEVIRLVM
jgi:LmbE family N-acetylglucosaminyl deacetylase